MFDCIPLDIHFLEMGKIFEKSVSFETKKEVCGCVCMCVERDFFFVACSQRASHSNCPIYLDAEPKFTVSYADEF